MSSSTPSQADLFKAEGNALFAKKNFKGAHRKYTEALKYDSENPVLYSNRAACSLGLNRYLDASVDATKATEIDPGYAKAWGRLATAKMGLAAFDKAAEAWRRALAALPTEKLSPAEKKQRDQYSSELAVAKAKLEEIEANSTQSEGLTIIRSWEKQKLPWERAIAILPDLAASLTWSSSAWVIERAYRSWERGVKAMKEFQIKQTAGGPMMFGRLGAIAELSNAILEDSRVFHISDENFASLYNQQMSFEAMKAKAWVESGPEGVMQEAPKRLEAEGWDAVRPALSITVRGWVVRAFIDDSLRNSVESALEFYNCAIDVLKWGAKHWGDVSFEEKGAIFQPTIARGIKSLRLGTLMKGCKENPGKYPYDELIASADELLAELGDVPPEPHVPDIAFYLSFFRYPMGQAHSIRAFAFLRKAEDLRGANGGGLTDDITKLYSKAGMEYLTAASCYPKDDLIYPWFLHCAYHAQFNAYATPRFLLSLLDMLEESIPLMNKIWEFSPEVVTFREALEKDLKSREDLQYALDTKQLELDSLILKPF
ncbi:hypothetical protein BJ322DRAFT_1215294 [Thelephora terrestris]|uniref:TPR-like protein n=1 Tax=Thelephora terrestris TaxID=56493 RepID=A0A9P6LBP2_9AGAM|nr:hypothetical protein BJ322DRAFT_1215294 [Thelephora terrestris]